MRDRMRDRIARIFAIVLLLLVVGGSYWYSLAIRKPQAAQKPAPGTPDFTAQRLVLTQFDEAGRARHKVFAEQMTHVSDNEVIELASPRIVSLRADQPQIEVRAQRARIENSGERVLLSGSVIVTREADRASNAPPMRLTSETLEALPDLDRYSTNEPVQVEHGQSTINAKSMVYDNIARTLEFKGDVRATFVAQNRSAGQSK